MCAYVRVCVLGGVRPLHREELGWAEEPPWDQAQGADESPLVGQAGWELIFGLWCRGRHTVVSTQGRGGPDVTTQEGLGGGLL